MSGEWQKRPPTFIGDDNAAPSVRSLIQERRRTATPLCRGDPRPADPFVVPLLPSTSAGFQVTMDPLSLTIGAVSLVGACHKIVQGLKILERLSQVASDIASLIDELQDLAHVLTTVCTIKEQYSCSQSREDQDNIDKLRALLLKASEIVVSVARHCGITIEPDQCCQAIADATPPSASPGQKIDLLTKFRWLKDQSKILQFRQRLKVVRLDISNHLASQNLLNTYSILAEVRDLAEVCRRLSIDKDDQIKSQALTTMPGISRVLPASDGLMESPTDIEPSGSSKAPVASHQHPASNMSSCSCACHRVTSFQSPRVTEPWFGHLQIRTGGIPYLTPACDQVLCRQNKHTSLRTSYRLPSWLSNRVFNSRFTSSNLVGPDLNLFSTRVISRNSQLVYYAMEGNIAGIKKLFSEGKASPLDVSHDYGYSALHYAVERGQFDLCEFLIKAGAKADLQDFDNHTPTDIAYNRLISQTHGQPRESERIQEIFDEEDWLEQKQLSALHKIVLGIDRSSRTLTAELAKSVNDLDVGDSSGRTPLSWAAELGNEAAVRLLLKFGANTDQADHDGNTPIHYACKTTSGPSVLYILINAGASPVKRNKWQQTPLNWASFHRNEPEYVKCLLFHPNVSLRNDVDRFGSTPIGNAVFNGHGTMLAFLLDNGADPNAGIVDGEYPLLESISGNGHDCLRILLSRARQCGISVSQPDYGGETCLHYMARRADLETIAIVMHAIQQDQVDTSALKTTRVGTEGLSPRDILSLRGDEKIECAMNEVLTLIDHESLIELSSISTEEVRYVDAFDRLQDLEEDIGLKEQTLVRVCEVAA